MKIISSQICPFVQRVTALPEAKHVLYDAEYIHPSKNLRGFSKPLRTARCRL